MLLRKKLFECGRTVPYPPDKKFNVKQVKLPNGNKVTYFIGKNIKIKVNPNVIKKLL